MALPCVNPLTKITGVARADGDLTSQFVIRWKKASDPDSAYVVCTDTYDCYGTLIPMFNPAIVPISGDYVVHAYSTAGGDTTGTKTTIHIDCDTSTVFIP